MQQNSLDRFSDNSIKDLQDTSIYDYCDYCGNEIYQQESYLSSSEGNILHDDLKCVIGYYQLHRKWFGEDDFI